MKIYDTNATQDLSIWCLGKSFKSFLNLETLFPNHFCISWQICFSIYILAPTYH